MHREIRVPLAISLLRIRESAVTHCLAVHHLIFSERQRSQRLGEQCISLGSYGDFARLRSKEMPFDSQHVADVQKLERSPVVFAQRVLSEVQLDAPGVVREMR